MSLDKSAGTAASIVGIIVFVAAVVAAWVNLNNRLDGMDKKITGIEKAIGSAACNAILTRQIDAIDRDRTKAREALEALSKQYECGPVAKSSI